MTTVSKVIGVVDRNGTEHRVTLTYSHAEWVGDDTIVFHYQDSADLKIIKDPVVIWGTVEESDES